MNKLRFGSAKIIEFAKFTRLKRKPTPPPAVTDPAAPRCWFLHAWAKWTFHSYNPGGYYTQYRHCVRCGKSQVVTKSHT